MEWSKAAVSFVGVVSEVRRARPTTDDVHFDPQAARGQALSSIRSLKTPNQAFYGPLVRVLREAGGELTAGEAVDRVGQLMADRLNDVDRSAVKSGEVRWRNTVRFARNDLVKQGMMDDESPFGIWRLAKTDGSGSK